MDFGRAIPPEHRPNQSWHLTGVPFEWGDVVGGERGDRREQSSGSRFAATTCRVTRRMFARRHSPLNRVTPNRFLDSLSLAARRPTSEMSRAQTHGCISPTNHGQSAPP